MREKVFAVILSVFIATVSSAKSFPNDSYVTEPNADLFLLFGI
jgi:hypothetical protein